MREYFESDSLDMSPEAAGVLVFIQDSPTQHCTVRELLRTSSSKVSEEENLETVSDALQELLELGRVKRMPAAVDELDALYSYIPRQSQS